MPNIKFIIYGDPRTKKNSLMIAGTGRRCPACGKPLKQWVKQSAQHDKWAKDAAEQITVQLYQNAHSKEFEKTVFPIAEPVNVQAMFYMGTRRKVDTLNLLAAVDDMLVAAGVLGDDNYTIVAAHDGSRVLYDKENPRIEIEIQSV